MADVAPITIPVNTSQVNMAIGAVGRLEGQIVKLERARQRGLITDQQYIDILQRMSNRLNRFTSDTALAAAEIQRFGNQIQGLDAQALNNLGRGLGQSQKGLAKFGLAAQQSGYQIGDFFVQVASGTSPIVAFTQQFSQLAGFFGGPWGAVVGAAAAVLGALAVAFWNTSESAKSFEDNLKGVTDALQTVTDLNNQLSIDNVSELEQAYGAVNAEVREHLKLMREMANDAAFKNMQATITSIQDGLTGFFTDSYNGLKDTFNLTLVQANLAYSAFEKAKNAADFTTQLDALTAYRAQLLAAVDATGEMTSEQTKHIDEVNKAIDEVMKLKAAADGVNFGGAINSAQQLANELGISVSLAQQLMRMGKGGPVILDPRDPRYDEGAAMRETNFGFEYETTSPFDREVKSPKRGRSGGSKGPDPEQLRESYQSLLGTFDPLIAAQNQYDQDLKMLNQALAAGAINAGEFDKALALIKKRLEEAKDPINSFKQGLEDALDPTKNYMKGLQALQSSLSEFLFNPFEVGLDGMVYSFSRALQKMASEALAAGIMKSLLGALGGGGSASIISWLGSANGNVFSNGSHVQAYANGGVIGGPTIFPMKGGKTGLMGEAGPEAIMPLKRGPNGKLGVEATKGDTAKSTKIINVLDPRIVGEYLNTPDGEEVIMNVMRRTGVV